MQKSQEPLPGTSASVWRGVCWGCVLLSTNELAHPPGSCGLEHVLLRRGGHQEDGEQRGEAAEADCVTPLAPARFRRVRRAAADSSLAALELGRD